MPGAPDRREVGLLWATRAMSGDDGEAGSGGDRCAGSVVGESRVGEAGDVEV
jgi:hypothetical protein